MKKKKCDKIRPVMHRDEIVEGYYSFYTGDIISLKDPINPKVLKPTIKNGYPSVSIRKNGNSNSVYVHRINCESWNGSPTFNGLTEDELNQIPDTIRMKLLSYVTNVDNYQVNHIDHNTTNSIPTNLEWVEHARENQKKYQDHRKTKKSA
jgi:hypothetical protein